MIKRRFYIPPPSEKKTYKRTHITHAQTQYTRLQVCGKSHSSGS